MTFDRGDRAADMDGAASGSRIDGVQLAVLNNRLQSIVRRMTNTLHRSGRSGVISVARDFSCCLVGADHELLAVAESLPIHVMSGPELISRYMTATHPELRAGDAFLHNSPYDGNSHAGDHCIVVPVVADGRHRFSVIVKAHMADIGNSAPCTVFPTARDVYEEGALIFPCVRIQENYEERADILRMCERRIRSPETWKGDFLAMVGAARIGERMLLELGAELGWDVVERNAKDWLDYSERRMIEVIGGLPAGEAVGTSAHDAFPGMDAPLPVRARVIVDPAAARVTIDLRENVDCLPNGLNLTESTARTAALIGFYMSIKGKPPLNSGSFRRFDILLRENCAVGIPRFPACCSAATTNLADRAAAAVALAMSEIDPDSGLAEIAFAIPASKSFISGTDTRRGGAAYVNVMLAGFTGGAGGPAMDGWLTSDHAGCSGMLMRDSTEPLEFLYPIYVWTDELVPNSEGAGTFRGAPSARFEFGPVDRSMVVMWNADGTQNPSRGARGGLTAGAVQQYLRDRNGALRAVDAVSHIELQPGETIVSVSGGGGGFGDPKLRDPRRVLEDVREEWIDRDRARTVYGVAVTEELEIDPAATERLRASAGAA